MTGRVPTEFDLILGLRLETRLLAEVCLSWHEEERGVRVVELRDRLSVSALWWWWDDLDVAQLLDSP